MKITLKAARINAGYKSQKIAAEKLEISEDTLSNYETGKTYPPIPIIKKMEILYDISYNDIIFLTKNNG